MASTPILAAGGVVFRTRKGKPHKYLVIHRPRYDDWSLPKGKLDRGETMLEAAVREIAEETGYAAKVVGKLGAVAYETDNKNPKAVHYWLMNQPLGRFSKNKEVDAIEWMPFESALPKLSYDIDRNVLLRARQLIEAPKMGTIYMVRHAEAGNRSKWKRSDRVRPITKKGTRQANALIEHIAHAPIDRIISSRYARCLQTLRPMSNGLATHLETDGALEEGVGVETTLALFRELAGVNAAVCTHGDVIANVMGYLKAAGVKLKGPDIAAKGSTWVLETRSGRVRKGKYLEPPR